MLNLFKVFLLSMMLVLLQGCLAGAVVNVLAETVEAGVEITGAVIGTAVDIVVPNGKDDEEKD
ncbi:MAG: hypothetical protein JKY88_01710 [Pseudomonadales bacterium]|nr:hypothetical protein [Pseudomonadales bacterium]